MAHLAHWAARNPEKTAAVFPDSGAHLTFAALFSRASRIAQWLIGLGLRPGEGIALLLENRPEFLELAFAARLAGLYYTPLSIHLRPREVAHVLRDSDAKLLLVSPAMAGLALELVAEGAGSEERRRFALGEGLPGYEGFEAALRACVATGPACRLFSE